MLVKLFEVGGVLWIDLFGAPHDRKMPIQNHLLHALSRSALLFSVNCVCCGRHTKYYVRPNFGEHPKKEEMGHFAELKTLAEYVGDRVIQAASFRRAAEWRRNERVKESEASQEQRSTTAKRKQNKTPNSRRRSTRRFGRRSDGLDLPSVIKVHCATRLVRDVESATCCTLFLPGHSVIVIDMQNAGRARHHLVVNHPDKEGRSPHVWFVYCNV